jgi:hypothetical protein
VTFPDIPPRLWVIQDPIMYKNVALVESNTAEGACDRAARMLNLGAGPFRSMSTESGRQIDEESMGQMLFAINVTGILSLEDASRLDDTDVIAMISELDEAEAFIAPSV